MSFLVAKIIHIVCALASGLLFGLRVWWKLKYPEYLRSRLVRVLPHLIDSLLLGSALVMVLMLHQYPLTHDWLTAKVVALLLYIVLGILLFRGAHDIKRIIILWLAAVGVYAYIVGVAVTHNVMSWLVML